MNHMRIEQVCETRGLATAAAALARAKEKPGGVPRPGGVSILCMTEPNQARSSKC